LILEPKGENTLLTLTHTDLPKAEFGVEQGWVDYYFTPMKAYFQSNK